MEENYTHLTPQEIEAAEAEIRGLKSLLDDTDYNSNKIIESMTIDLKDITEEDFADEFIKWVRKTILEYGEVVDRRAGWRKRINELEELIGE